MTVEITSKNIGLLELRDFDSYPTDLGEINQDEAIKAFRSMLLIRAVETQLADAKRDGIIGGPVHLGIGQEAIPVAISQWLSPNDAVFGAHRSHSHILALGSDPRSLFAEILGKKTGLSRGMGGSMHLIDKSVGFFGSVPIVAATVPLAVGAAMAFRLKASRDISVSYLGDGACEEGVVHESLNLASINREPVLFVVENNLFASHLHISERQPFSSTARFAEANNIPAVVCDGNDFISMSSISREAIAQIRDGCGPRFIEAITYRWRGHVDWREDIDVGCNRSAVDLDFWKKKDPVKRLEIALRSSGLSEGDVTEIGSEIDLCVSESWNSAINDQCEEREDFKEYVYASGGLD